MVHVLTDQERIKELELRVHQLTCALGDVLRDSDNPWHRELARIVSDQKGEADQRYIRKAKERGIDLG